MDVVEQLATGAAPEELFDLICDLDSYPEWLGLVVRAEPETSEDAGGEDDAAWLVELRAQLGLLARAKRLRMVRTERDEPWSVTFERREVDGRDHSRWVLHATIEPSDGGSTLTVSLHYDGRLFGPVLERVLRDEIGKARHLLATRYPIG
jgi:hypothetical protein